MCIVVARPDLCKGISFQVYCHSLLGWDERAEYGVLVEMVRLPEVRAQPERTIAPDNQLSRGCCPLPNARPQSEPRTSARIRNEWQGPEGQFGCRNGATGLVPAGDVRSVYYFVGRPKRPPQLWDVLGSERR